MWFVTTALAAPLLRSGTPALPSDLPTVEARIEIGDDEVVGEATLGWTNTTGAPLTELPILVHANDGAAPTTSLREIVVLEGGEATVDATPDIVLVRFAQPLAPGAHASVRLAWTSRLKALPPDVNDVFAQSLAQLGSLSASGGGGDYGLLATGEGLTVVASAVPMITPFVDGQPAVHVKRPGQAVGDLAWNGPTDWTVDLVLPEGVKAVTNLVDEQRPDGTLRAHGRGPGDLVVVAGKDLVFAEQVVNGVRVRSWSLARDADAGRRVLTEGARSLRFLERYGAYPYTELDLVEASLTNGAGGVEFGSLALIAAFLYRDPAASTNPMGQLVNRMGGLGGMLDMDEQRGFVVAHEVAHQWSPGFVVSDAWSNPVVDEPLAQYLAWRVTGDGMSPDAAAALADRMIASGYAMMRMMGGDDGPAARATSGFTGNVEYAGLIYGKAPGLYLALEQQIGRSTMDGALRKAFAARAWTTTDASTWLATLESSGGVGAGALGTRWWMEAHGDEDLHIDPNSFSALSTALGPQGDAIEPLLKQLGVTPESLQKMLGGK
ncbi:MAG: hypothetical protein KC621_13875 [Myxococcales bacterium]|nr:hypothetical protein [Myxococcales bacterium]